MSRIIENRDPGTVTFTEADWNQQSIDAVNNEGVEAWRMHWYRASKTLAERAAWDYMEKQKPSYAPHLFSCQLCLTHRFDLATICPPFVLGPIMHQADAAKDLNTCTWRAVFTSSRLAVATWYAFLSGEKTNEDATNPAGILCDVRDVARTHVAALLLPEAGGQRFGVATREFFLVSCS